MIGPGDYLQAQVNYTRVRTRYAALTRRVPASWLLGQGAGQGSAMGVGWFTDGLLRRYAVAVSLDLSDRCFKHQPDDHLERSGGLRALLDSSLRTSLVGAYTDVSYNAQASAQMCGA